MAVFHYTSAKKGKSAYTSRPFEPKADLSNETLTSIMNSYYLSYTAWYNNFKQSELGWSS